ncbi:hypothetical protein BGX34_002740 [Mortierella sp. NVP85]|nr:hypothetical protein BGX34_002740 [Mortierella sp. NVP85]
MFPARAGADKKAALVAQAKADRIARSGQKKAEERNALQDKSAIRIQTFWRRVQAQRLTKDQQRTDWDLLSTQFPTTPAQGLVRNLQLAFLLQRFYDPSTCPRDSKRLATLCKMLLSKTIIVAEENNQPASAGDPLATTTSPSSQSSVRQAAEAGTPTSIPKGDQKPMMQVPFQMILLHVRYSDLAASIIHRLLQLCIKAMIGHQIDADNQPISTIKHKAPAQAEESLYLSGPELRFVMAFVDTNTFRLPETVGAAIREQMVAKGEALIIRTLNSGQFYKDIRIGMIPRVEALSQLQERSKKTTPSPAEASRQKAISLWITAVWRSCLLLQSVDKDVTEKSAVQTKGNQFKDNLINLHSDESTAVGIACHILTVPLFVDCLDDLCLQLARQSRVLNETLDAVLDHRHRTFMLTTMTLNDILSLIGNMAQLCRSNVTKGTEVTNTDLKQQLVEVVVILLSHCQKYVSPTQTTEFRQYHPIFSWTKTSQKGQPLSTFQTKLLMEQMEYLWSREFALETFRPLLDLSLPPAVGTGTSPDSKRDVTSTSVSHQNHVSSPSETKSGKSSGKAQDPQGALLAIKVQEACLFYVTLMRSFDAQKTKILVTLMYLPSFLAQLWRLMATLGPKGGMVIYLEAAAGGGRKGLDQEPLIAILQIFCECCARFFITLDDDDMYEQQKPWELSELVFMSGFLNQFCFSILSQQVDSGIEESGSTTAAVAITLPPLPPIFYHARLVLMQLYERDCRRAFCPANHWLLLHPTKNAFQSPLQLLSSLTLSNKERSNQQGTSKSSNTKGGGGGNGIFSFGFKKSPPQYATPKEFITKVSQKDRTALQILETMPHVIPFSARLEIFRDFIKEEKVQRGQNLASVRPDLHQATMVRVRRGYILEDGYRNLGQLSPNGWKNQIRVKFVNEMGVDEIGIDQGGPFKEFMESFLESGFSPGLNLFTTTTASMNMLYPSPTSHATHPNNGLKLFQLFGKMLGKAMYEGLLIEVKFANFFLSKILGRTVFLDEMRSYDEQVFQNLMFVKKYEDDVEDLGLTFSLDEEVFGTHRTIELMRGGKDIAVTKENRINYIFKVSDYRLNKQIQDQSRAFIEGFRSIIPLPWISIFSPQELHRVIAGEDVDFDVQDLRAHTEYQNGYFDQHPVIRNLWAVLNEFNSEEKRAFLKFVTSCSKPPLGGFKHLHPPFSIRLVIEAGPEANNDNTPSAPRRFGSGHQTSQNSTSSDADGSGSSRGSGGAEGGLGSRLRSAFGGNRASRTGGGNGSGGSSAQASTTPTSSASNSPSSSSSSAPSGNILRRNQSSSRSTPGPFALTSDEHGTPAALGVVKSFFGGVLGSSNESTGKKARLPTSSTCFNLLKLPPFTSKSVLKEKLRYAIMSNTGFELS